MHSFDATRTTAFSSEVSIQDVGCVTLSDFERIDEHAALIESFSQPFPTRARSNPVVDGEMVTNGKDTAAIRLHG